MVTSLYKQTSEHRSWLTDKDESFSPCPNSEEIESLQGILGAQSLVTGMDQSNPSKQI
jgi:hypothetical protein